MRYSEIPAHHAPVFWVEVDVKRALCAVLIRGLHRLRMASSACPLDRCASGKSAVRGGQQTGGAAQGFRGRKTFMPSLHTEEVERHNFSQKCNCSSGSLGMGHLPTVSWQGCIPKDERCAALCCHTSSFLPPWLLQNCLHKAKKVRRRRRCMWRITTRSPWNSWWEVSQHRQVTTKMVWHTGMSELVLKSTELYLCLTSNVLLLLFPKRNNWGIFPIRDFLLINKLDYLAAAIDTLWITEDIYFYWLICLSRENSSSVLSCKLKFEDKISSTSFSCNSQHCCDCCARECLYSACDKYPNTCCLSGSPFCTVYLLKKSSQFKFLWICVYNKIIIKQYFFN